MRTLAAVALASLLAFSLAGCADDVERYPDGLPATSTTSRSATSTGTGSANATATGTSTASSSSTGPSNAPPVANVTAVPTNGTVPLNVTFSLSASDADGDALSWTLVFGDGNQTTGMALPATVVHSYTTPGSRTATFSVSDGQANATSRVVIQAAAAGEGGGAPATDPRCDRPQITAVGTGPAALYVDDDREDGGIWVYQESNGVAGLQLSADDPIVPPPVSTGPDNLGVEFGCTGGDTLIT
jgi:hypothetical protein